MTDEAVYQLAAMFLKRQRGHDSDLVRATEEIIELV